MDRPVKVLIEVLADDIVAVDENHKPILAQNCEFEMVLLSLLLAYETDQNPRLMIESIQ